MINNASLKAHSWHQEIPQKVLRRFDPLSEDSKTTFKQNLTCISLSVRANLKGTFQSEMLYSSSNKAPAIFVSFLLTEITTVMILVSFTYHGRTLQKL